MRCLWWGSRFLRCAAHKRFSSFGRNHDSLVLDRFLVRSYWVEIRVEKDRTAVDGRESRDSSPFDFAQGQNDGKDLWRQEQCRNKSKGNGKDAAVAGMLFG